MSGRINSANSADSVCGLVVCRLWYQPGCAYGRIVRLPLMSSCIGRTRAALLQNSCG
jgi:hypothetical protein